MVLRFEVGQGPITALALTPEQCFLAGTSGGALAAFAPDPRRCITRRLPLADSAAAAAATTSSADGRRLSRLSASSGDSVGGSGSEHGQGQPLLRASSDWARTVAAPPVLAPR